MEKNKNKKLDFNEIDERLSAKINFSLWFYFVFFNIHFFKIIYKVNYLNYINEVFNIHLIKSSITNDCC